MKRRPPRSTRTDTLFPYTTLFRSDRIAEHEDREVVGQRVPVLPALGVGSGRRAERQHDGKPGAHRHAADHVAHATDILSRNPTRRHSRPSSEERRVGKECVSTGRYWGSASPSKKKQKKK